MTQPSLPPFASPLSDYGEKYILSFKEGYMKKIAKFTQLIGIIASISGVFLIFSVDSVAAPALVVGGMLCFAVGRVLDMLAR